MRSLAVSASGILAYRADKRYATRLVWTDRKGRELGRLSKDDDRVFYYAPKISPDGRRVAVAQYEPNSTSGNVWVHDLDRGGATKLTSDEADESGLIWSPDGKIAASSIRGTSQSGVLLIDPALPGQGQLVVEGLRYPMGYSPDGRNIFYTQGEDNGRYSAWMTSLEEGATPRRIDSEFQPMVTFTPSPDGKWIAYVSAFTRRLEVYVRRLDAPASEGIPISTNGGGQPCWGKDGRELYYIDDAGNLVAVRFTSFDPLTPSAPEVLFKARVEESVDPQYDVTADGQRFILDQTIATGGTPISVMLDWRKRLTTK